MKKIVTLVFFIFMAMATAAMAGEKTWVFSDQVEIKIEKSIRRAYSPRRVQIDFAENYLDGSLVDCTTSHSAEYVQVFIRKNGDVKIVAVGSAEEKTLAIAQEVKNQVEGVFNPSALEELERNHLDKKGR